MPRADVLFEDGGFPALGEVAAEDAYDRVAAAFLPRLSEQIGVSVVERIVFTDDAANFHFFPENLYILSE